MTTLPTHWTVSAHRAYRACPRQFWLRYVRRVPGEDSRESIRGQVMHAGMAAGWEAAYFGGFQMSDRVERRIATDMTAYAWERFGVDEESADLAEWIETVVDAIERLGPVHPGDDQRIIAGCFEEEITGEIDGVPLKARVDLVFERDVDHDGIPDIAVIWDWKSSKELPRREEVRRDTQLGLEAWLLRQRSELRGPIRVAIVSIGPKGPIRVAIASIGSGVACEVDLPPDMAEAAARRVAATARLAENDTDFSPIRGEACASCEVRAHCPLFATGPVPEPEVVNHD